MIFYSFNNVEFRLFCLLEEDKGKEEIDIKWERYIDFSYIFF